MNQKKTIVDGKSYIEIMGTIVPEELTIDYMNRINPNRDVEIEEERKAHRATIPKSNIDLSYQNWHPMRDIEKLKDSMAE